MFDLTNIKDAVRYEGSVSRRLFLSVGAALSSLPLLARASTTEKNPRFANDPFSMGVASGDPDSESVVLWTKLAPQPLTPNGGMPNTAIEVEWQVSEDEAMNKVVRQGTAIATPQLGHTVHVEPRGLKSDRWYWYRFRVGEAESPIGRTRTLPDANAMPDRLRFAVASCQHYEHGFFTAYEQMARDDVDLVFFLGDYIYEGAASKGKVRAHLGPEIQSLGDYRIRYAQYRSDPQLHRMHALCPWFVTWDDHEFDNNCAGEISEQANVGPAEFLIRRAAAYQAYYEMMPLRRRSLPKGPHMQLFRRAPFGRLADLMVLDTRQYRSDQPNNDRGSPLNDAATDPKQTMLGSRQRNWLYQKLISSEATWNVLAQQVMMGTVGFSKNEDPPVYSMDQWPGYSAERRQLLKFIADRKVPNPVVLTGDIHSNWANELRLDDRDSDLDVVATEFVATSITSGGNGSSNPSGVDKLLADNPGIKFHNRERGYIRCTVTPSNWTSDYMVVDDISKPGGKVTPRASFVVEAGDPHINPA